ncbi:MAG: hypothetical protein A2W31_07870 [Planctomycetes bacterium RBG_16_64_10]|nr:MAG: hypothetical protein A2W31_07870 [Planctomycetes bacterium RBG_16_64_10]
MVIAARRTSATAVLASLVPACCYAAAGPDQPLRRLDPALQRTVVAALVALLLLGAAMMAFAWLTARWVWHRWRRPEARRPTGRIGPSDWDPQPWIAPRPHDPTTPSDDATHD